MLGGLKLSRKTLGEIKLKRRGIYTGKSEMNPKINQADMGMLYAIGKVRLQKHQNGSKKHHTNDFHNKCFVEHFPFDM